MVEDIVVMRRHLGSTAALCTWCGAPYPGSLLGHREGYPDDGIRSAFADVCPECDRLLRLGDEPAVPPAEEMGYALERST